MSGTGRYIIFIAKNTMCISMWHVNLKRREALTFIALSHLSIINPKEMDICPKWTLILMTREKLEGLQMETSLIFIHHPES
jgi:hypothetical protein